MRETFGPRERIRKKNDFSRLYKSGNRFRGKYFTLVYLDGRFDFSRLGVVASRKVGGAVVRNKVKRRIRELYRRNKTLITRPIDLVAIAKEEAGQTTWTAFREDFLSALKTLDKKRSTK